VVGHSMGATVATALAEQSPELATRVVSIDQAPDDSFEDLSFSAELGYTPVIGQALKRLTDVAPSSAVRDQYQQAFAPDFNIASGFEDPDQVVEDLQAMTYTAFVDATDAEGDYSGARPLDERLAAIEIPLLVIFGTEDQIYDAEDSIEPYRDVPGAELELIEGSGHSPIVERPDETAALILAFSAAPVPGPLPGEKQPGKGNGKGNGKGKAKGGSADSQAGAGKRDAASGAGGKGANKSPPG
ncbi:MAG: alpha/beta hydrolase, partial [Actinomycetota bacterium]|nr:alpha/beta hydrolase [Actinomycetota bacterium]